MSRTVTSGSLTFIDNTDNRKLDIYITSNLPITQIHNSNTGAYSPDWGVTPLQLSADIYLDSTKITPEVIQWYTKIGTIETLVSSAFSLTISTNVLSHDPIITYICKAKYQNIEAVKEITFSRLDTGLNGADGANGTSITVNGTAYYNGILTQAFVGQPIVLYSDTAFTTQLDTTQMVAGDSYIVQGYLCVYAPSDNAFICTGTIQGPEGKPGENAKSIILNGSSQVFKISKANIISPATITVTVQEFNTSVTDWTYSINGGQTFLTTVPTGVVRNGNIITITGATLPSNSLVIKASDGKYSDTYTIYKATDGFDGTAGSPGAPAPIVFLTNENITFSANAQGQIATTAITSNVVAYNGTTKVLPTLGDIIGSPSGMTITPSTITASNEIMLTITIEKNATLGSASSNMGVISIPIISPVSTVLSLTWSKINTGATGATGAAGSDAYTVMLTNESHIFAGDVSNAMEGSAITQILAYKGSTQQSVTIASVNGKTATTIDADTGIAGLKFRCSALSGTSPTITFTCTTAFVSASGLIPIVLSVNGVSFTKMFTYSIAFKGAIGATGQSGTAGASATSYWLVANANVVQKTSTGTIAVTPSTLTFTSKSQTGTSTPTDYACRWVIAYSTDGANYTNLYTSTANETSKSISVETTYKTIRVRMYLAGGIATLLDEQIIPIVSDGAKGEAGRGISSIAEYYLATTESTGVTTATSGWTTTIQSIDATKKYLWNYELITYTDKTTSTTVPAIIGVFGNTGATGKGIKSIVEYYLATTLSSGVTTSTSGWTTTMQTLTATNKYLWNYELITYTDNTTSTISPVIIGVYGDKGNPGDRGSDAYTVILTNESHIFAGDVSSAVASSATTQVMAYKGSASQSVTIVSVNGKTASTSSTATGITGLSFVCSALSGASPTITFTCTTSFVSPSGTIPIVLTVDGVTITKIFTYGIAFKGSTGAQGSTGTSASLVDITASAYYFKSTTGKDGTFTPEYIYLYPRFQTVTFSKWEYSVNGGTTWVAASGANGLSVSTYNSVANTLRIARTSTLYTDAVTSISFRCVSSNASIYDTVSITKIYDVVDLKMGVTFQLYAPKGYLLTNETPEVTLQVSAYEGAESITNATFKWSVWSGEVWTVLSGVTGTSLTVDKASVMKSSVYKCEMTYDGEVYEATATVEDKTDIYESLIRVIAKQSSTNRMYWILYATVYSEDGESDALLGPISETEPENPTTGAYWYKIDTTNYTVTLMKYSGTAWTTTVDTQELLYDWFLFQDAMDMITLGAQSKVKIVTANDFARVCSVQCNIFDSDYALLSRGSQVLNDPSDPIVSATEPPNPIDKQLWIKIADNGTYIISIWDEATKTWITSEADSQNKVHVEKPTVYSAGDIWIVGGDYQPIVYTSGVAQTTKHLVGTMLKAQFVSSTYSDSDWVEALNYKERIDDLSEQLNVYNQFFDFDETGLTMGAKNLSGQISEFKTKLTNTELGFYQGENKVAYINNNQLNISKAEINQSLAIVGTSPILSVGGFSFVVESNGSLSIVTNN